MARPKRKLTAAEKRAKRQRRNEYQTVFVNGKQKRVKRAPTVDGMDVDEFTRRNADPIWLHQNEMWEYLDNDAASSLAPCPEPTWTSLGDGLLNSAARATQRVLVLAVGGRLAASHWEDICHWSDERSVRVPNEASSDDWPLETQQEMEAFVNRLITSAWMPPILYRSEHLDCWSMGNVYQSALVKQHPDYCRQLWTTNHELIATWVRCSEQIVSDPDDPPETRWLYQRVNEAMDAAREFAEHRLIVLVRSVIGSLWTDAEIADSLATLPDWWTTRKPAALRDALLEPEASSKSRTECW